MKSVRIALVYDVIYPYVKGGGERRFYEIGTRLAKQGYEVHLYGMKFWDGPKVIKKDGMYLHGLMKARPLYDANGRRTISQALLFGLASFKLITAKFDVIDCCGFPYFSLFPCKIVALLKRKPLYATWHEVWGKKYWKDYLGALGVLGFSIEYIAARLPDTIIATSDHTKQLLQKELSTKRPVEVIHNGIDMSMLQSVKPVKSDIDIMYAGRIMNFKNIHLIIEAIASLKKAGTRLNCVIIGEGPHKTKLQKLATDLHVSRQIQWLGFLEKSEDVYAHMKAAKLFILPSSREGFGIVLMEANACGTPVLTANFAGNAAKDLIEERDNGYVFMPNITSLSASIKQALANVKELERSSRKVASKYDWTALTQNIQEVYAL